MNFRESLVALLHRQCLQAPRFGAEIGVHRGRTSKLLLTEFQQLHLYLVDTWAMAAEQTGVSLTRLSAEEQEAFYRETIRQVVQFADRAEILRVDSVAAAGMMTPLDFAFIDADHSRQGCARDLAAYWPVVRKMGLLCGHDYGKEDLPGVTEAVDAFAQERQLELHVEEGNIWWLRKN